MPYNALRRHDLINNNARECSNSFRNSLTCCADKEAEHFTRRIASGPNVLPCI